MSPQCGGIETSIRQLIVNGKSKTALDSAKEFHKKQPGAASETLLIDAYLARIEALSAQNLHIEAGSLIALVRERFPSANQRLEALKAVTSARGGNLDDLVRPLNDPQLSAERRASIEQIVQNQVTDLAALAGCTALPPEHTLREAAAALDRAFVAVTSGPVTDEQIALTEVSYRSPLAPWKLLIRAIACFYREQDKSCEEYLVAIKPESAPWRLVRAMKRMCGPGAAARPAADLKPAEAALATRTCLSLSGLRGALENLDRAFAHGDQPAQIFKAIRTAVRECRQSAPDLLMAFQQAVFIRGEVSGLDMDRVIAALEGAPRRDAAFLRDLARTLEGTGDQEDLFPACAWWDCFRQEAVREGWFPDRGIECAALYLHMAGLLGRMPPELLKQIQPPAGGGGSKDSNYFCFPEELYARACLMDPHADAFRKWLRRARQNSVGEAEKVAHVWNKALPSDAEPLLFLMNEAERRNAFPTALSYLDKAERIDAVNPTVRAARLRLLAAGAMRNLQQKKPHLAAQRLGEIAALPQSRQGDRPAFLAALRLLICRASGDKPGVEEARLEAERALDDRLAAALLVFGCASFASQEGLVFLPPPKTLSEEQRQGLPASMARVIALARDIGLTARFHLPISYFDETEAQFPDAGPSLDVEQLRSLGEMGISTGHPGLAWEASAAGLERDGGTEAYFLLLRARALPEGHDDRYDALVAAASELGRFHRDMETVDRAVEAGRNPFDDEPLTLTVDKAREVLRKEKASSAFPSYGDPGPDYSDLFPGDLCMCPSCRAARAEASGPDGEPDLDEAEMERSFYAAAPKDIPPELLPALLEVAKKAFFTGEDVEETMARMLGGKGGKRKKGKGR